MEPWDQAALSTRAYLFISKVETTQQIAVYLSDAAEMVQLNDYLG
jgi:hypothetical protein